MTPLEGQRAKEKTVARDLHRGPSRYREVSLAYNADACALLYTVPRVI